MKPNFWSFLACFFVLVFQAHAQVSVTTSRNNNNRDGQNLSETILTPDNVNAASFGKLFAHTLDGSVYAQPLYMPSVAIPGLGTHNVVYVVTEHDSVYAFDADSNTGVNARPLWYRSFTYADKGITTLSTTDVKCTNITPEIGITGTPVIDPVAGTIFLVARTKENGQFFQRLHALDITTGKDRPGSPKLIQAHVDGKGQDNVNGVISFDPLHDNQRAGLLLQNGNVYISWASHCDLPPYHGWLIAYDETTLRQTGVWNSTPNGKLGGIWESGIGLASDSDSNVFLAIGNGSYDGKTGGNDFGDSIVRLTAVGGNRFHLADWFTPYNQLGLANADKDVGSGGVLLLPDQGEGAPHEHLLIEVGKEGSIYLIDRDNMGHFSAKSNSQIVQDMENSIAGMFSTPAWWNNNVYFGGAGDYLRQFTFDSTTEQLSAGAVSVSPTQFGWPGSSPSISANGASDAIVWALETDAFQSGSAILHAYDAMDIATELYNTNQSGKRDNPGEAVKFTVPTIANGKVYVPAVKQLTAYGLLSK
jgi:hypothetical protein